MIIKLLKKNIKSEKQVLYPTGYFSGRVLIWVWSGMFIPV